jgi:hypothetical protein
MALKVLLSEHRFRGRARRVRCFAHTLNLAAKAILRQFEKPKGKKKHPFDNLPSLAPIDDDDDDDDGDDDDDDDDDRLGDGDKTDLSDIEEMLDNEGDENQDARNEEEIDNLFEAMTMAEQEEWKEQVRPLRSALQKVGC